MILELEDIDTYYGLGHILHGLSLNVNEGEVVAMLDVVEAKVALDDRQRELVHELREMLPVTNTRARRKVAAPVKKRAGSGAKRPSNRTGARRAG